MPKKKVRAKGPSKEKVRFEKQVEQFSKEAGALGKRAGEKSRECCGGYSGAFGAAGLVLSVTIGVLGLAVSIWALDFLANKTGSAVLFSMHDFLLSNLGTFILIFLLSSLLKYTSWCCPRGHLLISPFATAFGIIVFFWVAANVMEIANIGLGSAGLFIFTDAIKSNLAGIFWFFSIIGYFFLLIRLLMGRATADACCGAAGREPLKEPQRAVPSHEPGGIKRLYRSGKDKVLGGVCGGIAEYLGVDPVLIRLIWAIAVFYYGSGILLYIIAWIIIPRNPGHEWRD